VNDVRIIKTYDRKVGKLIFKGKHRHNELVPEVAFIQDGSDHDEAPYILYGRDHDNYHLATPANLGRLANLRVLDEEIEQIKKKMEIIISGMTDPIYAESYWKHATPEVL